MYNHFSNKLYSNENDVFASRVAVDTQGSVLITAMATGLTQAVSSVVYALNSLDSRNVVKESFSLAPGDAVLTSEFNPYVTVPNIGALVPDPVDVCAVWGHNPFFKDEGLGVVDERSLHLRVNSFQHNVCNSNPLHFMPKSLRYQPSI